MVYGFIELINQIQEGLQPSHYGVLLFLNESFSRLVFMDKCSGHKKVAAGHSDLTDFKLPMCQPQSNKYHWLSICYLCIV
jgi:hypothetical protein